WPRPMTTTAASSTSASRYQGSAVDPGCQTRSPLTAMVWLPCFIVTTHSGMTVWRLPGLACTWGGLVASIQWIRWSCQRATGSEEIFCQSVSPGLAFSADGGGCLPFLVWFRYVAVDSRFWNT